MLKSITMLMILSLLLCSAVPATQHAAIGIKKQARLDAKNDAARDASKIKWGLGGFFCGVFGVATSVVYKPIIPAENLLGKSPDYMLAYKPAYKSAIKRKNIISATTGCLAAGGVTAIVLVLSRSEE